MTTTSNYLALDVGSKRIGVAMASGIARLPRALTTLDNTETVFDDIKSIIDQESIGTVVVGLPRNLSGEDTEQTKSIRHFAEELQKHLKIPVHMQDEALTSRAAEAELQRRGKGYEKSDIDALAAEVILGDYIEEHTQGIQS